MTVKMELVAWVATVTALAFAVLGVCLLVWRALMVPQ